MVVDPTASPGEISGWQSCNDSRVASVRLKHTEEEKERFEWLMRERIKSSWGS